MEAWTAKDSKSLAPSQEEAIKKGWWQFWKMDGDLTQILDFLMMLSENFKKILCQMMLFYHNYYGQTYFLYKNYLYENHF